MTASRGPMLQLLLLCVFGALVCSSSAANYKLAWTIPSGPSFYDDWAGTKSFEVGDSIEFDHSGGLHNVFLVSPADLVSCELSSPIQEWNEASPVVTLDRPGTASFVCGLPGHCKAGMKLTVQVVASAAAPPPAPPAPQQPPPTKAPPANPPPSPRRRSAVPPVEEPVAAPVPSPPKKKNPSLRKGHMAPSPAPAGLPDFGSSIAPSPFPETAAAAASVLRSTMLVIVATLLVSCGALLF